MEGHFTFQWGRGGGIVFQMVGASFLRGGGATLRGIGFDGGGGGGFEKNCWMRRGGAHLK